MAGFIGIFKRANGWKSLIKTRDWIYFCEKCFVCSWMFAEFDLILQKFDFAPMAKASSKKSSSVKVCYDNNSNMVESLIFTRAQIGGNIYRQRFLLRLMELAQSQIKANLPAVYGRSRLFFDSSYDPVVEIPVRSILQDESDEHYSRAKKAILDFATWVFVYEDSENFTVTPVLRRSNLAKSKNMFQFRVEREVWEAMFNFTKGFNVYNISIALLIENELALKIYKGLEKQQGQMFYTFDAFRKAFGFTKRYMGRNHDLVKYMIEPAKQELDEKSPWTFEYTLTYGYMDGKTRGRKSLMGITIIPVHRLGREGMEGVRKRIHPSDLIGRSVWLLLTEKLYFTYAEVKANLTLFELGTKNLGENNFADWLNKLVPKAVRADYSTQGYVVNSLRSYLRKKFGIVVGLSDKPHSFVDSESFDSSVDVQESGNLTPVCFPSVTQSSATKSIDDVKTVGDLFAGMDIESLLK